MTDCPLCNGTGKFNLGLPRRMQVDAFEIKKKIAKELRAKGYSIRQIMVALGYKSTRSISLFIHEK